MTLYQASFLRPLSLLRRSVFLPVLLRTRDRKPCLRFWIRRVCPFMVFRGPHRICEAAPARAGWAEMADLGTRSATAAPAGEGAKLTRLGRIAAVEGERLGRRGVRVAKVL